MSDILGNPFNYMFNYMYVYTSIWANSCEFGTCRMDVKVRKGATISNQYNQVPQMTKDTTWESDKTQENITYMRANRPALSKQVTTRLQWTDKTVWQTRNINNKKGFTKEAQPWNGQNFLLEGLTSFLWDIGN